MTDVLRYFTPSGESRDIELEALGNGNYTHRTSPAAGTVNSSATLIPVANYTSTQVVADQTNKSAAGILLILNVVTAPGVQTLQLALEAKDPASNAYITLATLPASVLTGVFTLLAYPGAVSASLLTGVLGIPLPLTWRARTIHSAGGTWNYSLGALLLR
jgi:hypothetical protein